MNPSGTDLIWLRVKQLAEIYAARKETPSLGNIERDLRRLIGKTGNSRIEREALAFYCREARDLAEEYRARQRTSATAGR